MYVHLDCPTVTVTVTFMDLLYISVPVEAFARSAHRIDLEIVCVRVSQHSSTVHV